MEEITLPFLAYQVLVKDKLCGKFNCPEALIERDESGQAVDYAPCRHCKLPGLEEALNTQLGEVLIEAIEFDNDMRLGFQIGPEALTCEEYEALSAIHWARNRREKEIAEEQELAAAMRARRR